MSFCLFQSDVWLRVNYNLAATREPFEIHRPCRCLAWKPLSGHFLSATKFCGLWSHPQWVSCRVDSLFLAIKKGKQPENFQCQNILPALSSLQHWTDPWKDPKYKSIRSKISIFWCCESPDQKASPFLEGLLHWSSDSEVLSNLESKYHFCKHTFLIQDYTQVSQLWGKIFTKTGCFWIQLDSVHFSWPPLSRNRCILKLGQIWILRFHVVLSTSCLKVNFSITTWSQQWINDFQVQVIFKTATVWNVHTPTTVQRY